MQAKNLAVMRGRYCRLEGDCPSPQDLDGLTPGEQANYGRDFARGYGKRSVGVSLSEAARAHVREERRRRALTQERFARKAGLSNKTVSVAEAGRAISLETVRLICQVLGIDPRELMDMRPADAVPGDGRGPTVEPASGGEGSAPSSV